MKNEQALEMAPQEAMPTNPTAESLIARGIEKGLTVETMKELLAMRRELNAEQAKKDFDEAMATFQGECPTIKKKKAGGKTKSGSVAYMYAPLETIVEQVKEFLQKNGFSYRIETEMPEGKVKVTCTVKHKAGHSEQSTMEVPLGTRTEIMSAPQVVAATVTFAKRYAFTNAFGIMTGDDDTDALKTKAEAVAETAATDEQKIEISELAQQLNMTASEITKRCQEKYGLSFTKITSVQAAGIIESLKQKVAKLGN